MTIANRLASARAVPLVLLLAGCGGADVQSSTNQPRDAASAPAQEATSSAVAAVVSASAAPSSTPAPADAHARRTLEIIRGSEGVGEVQGGRMAAFALADDMHELPLPMKTTLKSITSEGVEPFQKGLLAGFMCGDPDVGATIEKLCGKPFNAVNADLKKVPAVQRSARLTELCKLTVTPSKDRLAKIDARGLLVANAVADALIARSASASELELAALIPNTFPLDPEGSWR